MAKDNGIFCSPAEREVLEYCRTWFSGGLGREVSHTTTDGLIRRVYALKDSSCFYEKCQATPDWQIFAGTAAKVLSCSGHLSEVLARLSAATRGKDVAFAIKEIERLKEVK